MPEYVAVRSYRAGAANLAPVTESQRRPGLRIDGDERETALAFLDLQLPVQPHSGRARGPVGRGFRDDPAARHAGHAGHADIIRERLDGTTGR